MTAAALAMAAYICTAPLRPAEAKINGGADPNGTVTIAVSDFVHQSRSGQSCTWTPANVNTGLGVPASSGAVRQEGAVIYVLYQRTCGAMTDWVWVPQLTGQMLADNLYDEAKAHLPRPRPSFSPPVDKLIVNLETWVWLPGQQWTFTPLSASILTGLAATVTATPSSFRFDPGDGSPPIACPVPTSEPQQCRYTYRHASTTGDLVFHATVDVTWTLRWTATDGTSGAYAPVDVTATADAAVFQLQTIVVGG
jgi:hypothetical protein